MICPQKKYTPIVVKNAHGLQYEDTSAQFILFVPRSSFEEDKLVGCNQCGENDAKSRFLYRTSF